MPSLTRTGYPPAVDNNLNNVKEYLTLTNNAVKEHLIPSNGAQSCDFRIVS